MKNVKIYTWPTCPFCTRAKRLLYNKEVQFTEIDISNNDEMLQELKSKTNCGTVPQIFVDDNFIGGCDDVVSLHKQGKFDSIFR